MDREQASPTVVSESEKAGAANSAPRRHRRRKAKVEATVAPVPAPEARPEIKPEPKLLPTAEPAASTPGMAPSTGAAAPAPIPTPMPTPRAVSVLPPGEQRKTEPAKLRFLKGHGPLAAGMALALGLGAYAGTQIGFGGAGDSGAGQAPSVNIAAALPWKRDVAMASTQAREITRLKEELRGVRTQIDALKANPDQARQAQDLKSLRAGLENLKEGLTATRTDTANAIAQVSSAQGSKAASEREQQRIEKIAERLDRLERHVADPTPTAVVPQKVETPKPVTLQDPQALPTPADIAAAVQKAEPKPKLIHNYVVREVADGVALIEGPDGLREVWPGRGVPGAGKVTSIERQAGKWVVITSEGLIEFRRDAYLRN